MGTAPADIARYERALKRYFQVPVAERKTKDREKILGLLGIENPHEFLTMHIPLWEVKVDELIDPSSTDMLPISISHSYVNWVRGAIRLMPGEARVKILASKLRSTELRKPVLDLLARMTGGAVKDFQILTVDLVDKVHKDTLFSVKTDKGRKAELYLSRFGCLGEYIYAGLPPLVGLPALPVVFHATPQGEEVLVKPKEEGINICLDEDIPATRILKDASWWVEGAARQDALGDCLGTALRYGHYIATPDRQVVMIDNIELFHLDETDVRIFEPLFEVLPRKAHPDDRRRRESLNDRLQEEYEAAYAAQKERIRKEWAEVERYLSEMRRHVRAYTGDVFENILAKVRARAFAKP